MLKTITPKNARSKRALEKREPKIIENQKTVLFLRGTSASGIVQAAADDLHSLKKPHVVKFQKKNDIHPFEDASSLEFFSEKNDTSLICFASHNKKRPHNMTFVRTFGHQVFDMMELLIDGDSFKKMADFKNAKCGIGLKPMMSFSGPIFDSNPTYQHLRSLFIDFFRGNTVSEIDVEALQFVISISVGEPTDDQPNPPIHFRVFLIKTQKSGQKLPRVELEEMGPRIDFKIGRTQQATDEMMKMALQKSKALEARTKKNIETDMVGDKMGRIHLGKQDIKSMQTRKMKGLKRSRGQGEVETVNGGGDVGGDDDVDVEMDNDGADDGGVSLTPKKVRTA